MSRKAAITVHRSREETERLWQEGGTPDSIENADAEVTFTAAPADRGTEIRVELRSDAPAGKLGQAVGKLTGKDPLAKVKDDLRRFKQHVETGEIPRSEGTPEGESAQRKLKQRPAQPLTESEREQVGV